MAEAAAAGQLAWVKELLGRFDCKLVDPLQLAAAHGHAAVVAELLCELVAPGATPSREKWRGILDAVSAAGEKEHLAVLQVFLPILAATRILERKEAVYDTASAVLEDAAARGSLDVVKFMIAQATPIFANFADEGEGSFALGRAISAKQMDVVELLLNLNVAEFRLDYIGAYDAAALAAGLNELADRIYGIYSRSGTGRRLLVELADYNYVNAVKYILGKGIDLDLVEAFETAAMGSAIPVVEFLWSSFNFSNEVFDRVFENTATSGWQRSEIPTLYRMKHPSPPVIDRVFRVTDSVAVLKLLLENEQVSNDAIVDAFEHAARGYF